MPSAEMHMYTLNIIIPCTDAMRARLWPVPMLPLAQKMICHCLERHAVMIRVRVISSKAVLSSSLSLDCVPLYLHSEAWHLGSIKSQSEHTPCVLLPVAWIGSKPVLFGDWRVGQSLRERLHSASTGEQSGLQSFI